MPPLREIPIVLLAAAGTLAGCTLVGTGAPRTRDAPAPSEPTATETVRHFDGAVALGGQELAVSLELRAKDPPRHEATLMIRELGLEARGEGTLSAELLSLDLSYDDGDCPGRMHVEARLDPEGREAAGALTATDCTGGESGTILLARRIVTPADGEARARWAAYQHADAETMLKVVLGAGELRGAKCGSDMHAIVHTPPVHGTQEPGKRTDGGQKHAPRL